MHDIQTIVFDFDGVLVDSNSIKREAYFRVFSEVKGSEPIVAECVERLRDANRFEVISHIVRGLQAIDRRLARRRVEELVDECAKAYNDICVQYTSTCAEVRGTTTAIRDLSGEHALYINSATLEDPLRRVVQRRGWGQYFRGVFGSPRTKVDNLSAIAEGEAITQNQMVFVGDSQHDLDASRRFGCRFIGVRSDFNDFSGADLLMIDDLSDLPSAIAPLKINVST